MTVSPYGREVLLERRINDELGRLCKRYAGVDRWHGRLTVGVLLIAIYPVIGLVYRWLEHSSFDGFAWAAHGLLIVLAVAVAVVGHWFISRSLARLAAEVRRACSEAANLGFHVLRTSSPYHYGRYQYPFILSASPALVDSGDSMSGTLAEVNRFPGPFGLASLLNGDLPAERSASPPA